MNSLLHNLRTIVLLISVITLTGVYAVGAQCESKTGGDFALFNSAKGVWYTNSADGCAFTAVKWGMASDKLVPADYDGDGTLDAAVWRPTTGEWLIGKSKISFGVAGDVPVQADYDGDRKADIAVFRTSENRWLIQQSSDGRLRTEIFGQAGKDTLVPADYTGDGKADIAVYSNGKWTVLNSENGEIEPFVMGFADDVAAPGDYDGDGTADFAVFRKGTWYIYDSGRPRFRTFDFGNETDVPLNAAATKKSFSP